MIIIILSLSLSFALFAPLVFWWGWGRARQRGRVAVVDCPGARRARVVVAQIVVPAATEEAAMAHFVHQVGLVDGSPSTTAQDVSHLDELVLRRMEVP